MKQRNRTTTSIVAGSATALLLAGCFSGNVSDEAADIQVSRDLTDEDITLTLTYIDEPPTEALIEGFEEEHPNISIDTTQIPFTDYIKSIQRSMDSSSAPDIVQFNPGAMRSLIPAGLVRDLTPYQEEYGWDDTFPPSMLEAFRTSEDAKQFNTGNLYATPGALSVLGVFYNKDLLDEAGISSPPETIDAFEEALSDLDAHDIQPFIVGGLEIGGFQLWNALADSLSDVEEYKDWVYGADDASIETEGALQAATYIESWVEEGYISQGASSVSDSDALAAFSDGEAAFFVTGNWNAHALSQSLGDSVGFFPMPGESPDSPHVASGSSVAFSISASSDHPNEAAAFLDYLATPEAAQIQVDVGFMPVDTEADIDADGLTTEVVDGFALINEGAGIVPFADYATPGMFDELVSGVQGIITETATPEDFLDQLQSEWDSYHG